MLREKESKWNVPQCAFNLIFISAESFIFHLHYDFKSSDFGEKKQAFKSFTLFLENKNSLKVSLNIGSFRNGYIYGFYENAT